MADALTTTELTGLRGMAAERAEARADFYVRWGFKGLGVQCDGPMTEAEAADMVRRLHIKPGVPDYLKVLRVVEDYEA